ncbi:MAG: ParA family protein, partial [Pseudomonadota bacterium]
NLGVYFAAKRNKSVLFVDLDWQGSLSENLLALSEDKILPAGRIETILKNPFPDRRANRYFEARGRLKGVQLRTNADFRDALRDSAFYLATDALADLEDWLLVKWSRLRKDIAEEELPDPDLEHTPASGDDVRFRLLRFLLSEKIQSEFDMVILDAPPRDTTAGINGLCAATHLIVPTRADLFSTNGAFKFIERVAQLKDQICPHLLMLGFVKTMVSNFENEPDAERSAREDLIQRVKNSPIARSGSQSLHPIPSHFPIGSRFDFTPALYHHANFRDAAGRTVAYVETNEIRTKIIDPIGDEITARMADAERAQHGEQKTTEPIAAE